MANEYGEIEQLVNDVTSLDTARMTLRWALERLNTIEKEKADLKKNLAIAEETSKRLQLKDASLTDAYSSRSKTLEEKEDFYTKLEATMSLLGEGKLDIQQLLKKEAKLDSLRHNLENEYSDKFEELDRNQRSVIERWNSRLLEVESQYAGRLAEAQKKYDGLRAELEGDYQGRLNALQASFRSREKELSERIGGLENSVRQSEEKVETRRRELEGEYLIKKRGAEENYRKLRSMLEAGLEEKIRAMDSDHAAQVSSFEASWQTERARLLEEQRVREDQFSSAQDRIKEIENKLASQQETHHSEVLRIISEKETAFRAQLLELENEKSAKEAMVRELQARLEKKADVWEADRSRLQAEFDGRLGSMEAGLRERAASLEREYAGKKAELENTIKESERSVNSIVEGRTAQLLEALELAKAENAGFETVLAAGAREAAGAKAALRGELSEKEKMWALEREKLSNAFAKVSEEAGALAEERVAAIRSQYEERKAGLEKEFEIEFAGRAKAFEAEKARAKELAAAAQEKIAELRREQEAEKNLLSSAYGEKLAFMEQELIRVQSGNKEELAVMQENFSREKERSLEEAAKRERSLETSYGEKLAFMEQELIRMQSGGKEEQAIMQENHLREKERLQEDISKREQYLEAAGLKIRQLEDEMLRRRQEQAKVMLAQLGSQEDKFNALLEEQRSRAQLKEAKLKEEYEAEKSSLISAYGDKLVFMEQELIRLQSGAKEELAVMQENSLREKERLQEELEKRDLALDERMAAAQAKAAKLKEEYEAEKSSLVSAYGDKLVFMEQELIRSQSGAKEELAVMQENSLREKERLQEELEKRDLALDERMAAAQAKAAKLKEEYEAEKSSLVSAYGDKLVFMEQELMRAQGGNKEELAIMQENSLREKERIEEELAKRNRDVETAELKIRQLEDELLRHRQDSGKITLEQIGAQEEKFKALLEEQRAMQNASERDYAAKLEAVKKEAASRIKQLEEMLLAKEDLVAGNEKICAARQAELDKRRVEVNLRLNGVSEEMFAQQQELGEKGKALDEYRLKLEKDYALKTAELERLRTELTRAIMDYKSRK